MLNGIADRCTNSDKDMQIYTNMHNLDLDDLWNVLQRMQAEQPVVTIGLAR